MQLRKCHWKYFLVLGALLCPFRCLPAFLVFRTNPSRPTEMPSLSAVIGIVIHRRKETSTLLHVSVLRCFLFVWQGRDEGRFLFYSFFLALFSLSLSLSRNHERSWQVHESKHAMWEKIDSLKEQQEAFFFFFIFWEAPCDARNWGKGKMENAL